MIGFTPVCLNLYAQYSSNVSTERKRNDSSGNSWVDQMDVPNSKRNKVTRRFINSQTGIVKPLSSASCRKIQRLLIGGWGGFCLGTIFALTCLHKVHVFLYLIGCAMGSSCTENRCHFSFQEPGKLQFFLSVLLHVETGSVSRSV